MSKYYPPINERETEDLIEIANSSTTEWQLEAIREAKIELKRRNVSEEEQEAYFEKYIIEMENMRVRHNDQYSLNAFQKYKWWEMVWIFLVAPILLVGQIDYGQSLFELKANNFKIKFLQRIILLFLGSAFWLILFYYNLKEWIEIDMQQDARY